MTDVKTTGASDTRTISGGNPNDNRQIISADQVTIIGDGSIERPLRSTGGGASSSTFNIMSYGAVPNAPDAAEINSQAFQDAMAAALAVGGGVIYVPRGTFTVTRDGTGPWCIDVAGDNLAFTGDGSALSIIKMAAGQPASSTILLRVNGRDNTKLSNLTLDGNWGAIVGVTTTQAGINQGTQADPQNHGVMLRGASNVKITSVKFTQIYGDAIWMGANANDDLTDVTENVIIDDCLMYICARNGVTFGAPAHVINIANSQMSVIFSTCVDAEPQGLFDGVRYVTISRCDLDGWWNDEGGNLLISVVGGFPVAYNQSAAARGWRILDNYRIHGSINVFSAIDIVIARNRFVTDFDDATVALAPIWIDHVIDDITIEDNYIYDNTPVSLNSGDPHNGSIQITAYTSGNNNQQPAGIRVKGNRIHSRKGTRGIWINAQGGFSIGDATPIVAQYNGVTSTAVTALTLTDALAAWTVNQWIGWRVITGGVVACITANSATQLTLEPSYLIFEPNAWFTPTGERSTTPAVGAYVITSLSGILDIEANDIDCGSDGNAAGGVGIYLFNDRAGGMLRVRENNVKNPTTWGLFVAGAAVKAIQMMDIRNNRFYDDRGSAALMSAAMRFPDAESLNATGRRIINDNSVIRGGAPLMSFGSGGTTEQWLLSDGATEQWTGYGAPTATPANGSTYQRLDGGALTTFYVRVGGVWTGIA